MLNTTNQRINNNTNIEINACSGGIYKTYPKSFFKRFHLQSELAKEMLEESPKMSIKTGKSFPEYEKVDIVVIQMVICGDMEVMAEIIRKDDFEEYLNSNIKE